MQSPFTILKTVKYNWIWIFIFIFLMGPSIVNACPFCAGQDNQFSEILVPIGFLLGTPFAVAGIFIAVIVKHNKTERDNT